MEKIDFTKLSRKELLLKCEELKMINYKSKNKNELINIINENKNIKLNNVSPLRYPGGKIRPCKIINNITKLNALVSPFFGGGSFEFYFQNKYNYKLIINDKFIPLYNFWSQIKTNKYILCHELKKKYNNY